MPYVAPTTHVAGETLPAADWNVVVNDVIALATRPYFSVTSAAAQTGVTSGTALTGMTGTSTFTGAPVLVKWGCQYSGAATGQYITFGVYLDGVLKGFNHGFYLPSLSSSALATDWAIVTPTAGSHTITIQCASASTTWIVDSRQMVYYELG
jgi:hypothetical protein